MIIIKALLSGLLGFSLCMADISGTVTDTSGTIPLSGATVQLEKDGRTATTGADGRFALAVGTAVLPGTNNQFPRTSLSATIHKNLLCMNVAERSAIEVETFDLTGKALSSLHQTLDAGAHSIVLPRTSAEVLLYKVKSGNGEFLIKGNSASGAPSGSTATSLGFSSYTPLAKQAKSTAVINDVIAVKKTGYLNYRVVVTNSDTSGIEIKMITCADTIRDIDGNLYQAVKIGNQVWTVENLRTTNYNDGSAIPLVTDSIPWSKPANSSEPAFCWYANDSSNRNKCGALYNFFAVNTGKLAPKGWHVPTYPEWKILAKYLVANGYNYDGTTDTTLNTSGLPYNNIAKSLAAGTDWCMSTGIGDPGKNVSDNNKSGFSAFPSGYRSSLGNFICLDSGCIWWAAKDVAASGFNICLSFSTNVLGMEYWNSHRCGFSVRLIKD
jgi:uncharacterized protein (TIGR02145 family)